MTDPIRRDPSYFLRALKRMAHNTSWQKAMVFAAKGRMIGYPLSLEHYNTILFSQSMWGRALEITKVVRAMQEDRIQPNGATYYYICNGMGNVDHGYVQDFAVNHKLKRLQHWRLAIEALQAAECNGFDTTDTMYNSVIASCTIPEIQKWEFALQILERMNEQERKPHPQMIQFLHQCLVRNMRVREASALMRYANEKQVPGYEHSWEPDIFEGAEKQQKSRDKRERSRRRAQELVLAMAASSNSSNNGNGDTITEQLGEDPQNETKKEFKKTEAPSTKADTFQYPTTLYKATVNLDTVPEYRKELKFEVPQTGGVPAHADKIFRPRVYRGLWYKWHQVTNRYRPTSALRKRQIAPKHSPTGIPGFNRL